MNKFWEGFAKEALAEKQPEPVRRFLWDFKEHDAKVAPDFCRTMLFRQARRPLSYDVRTDRANDY